MAWATYTVKSMTLFKRDFKFITQKMSFSLSRLVIRIANISKKVFDYLSICSPDDYFVSSVFEGSLNLYKTAVIFTVYWYNAIDM